MAKNLAGGGQIILQKVGVYLNMGFTSAYVKDQFMLMVHLPTNELSLSVLSIQLNGSNLYLLGRWLLLILFPELRIKILSLLSDVQFRLKKVL